jgi:TetR/AcrR family transcriptional regulator, regulator of cefoperazone and chloramphenicol sensitivity
MASHADKSTSANSPDSSASQTRARSSELRRSVDVVVREDDAKQRLIDAAGPVFAHAGFDRATVREICRDAGVNVAAVGYHFGDKFGLYREVIRAVRSRCQGSAFPPPPEDLSPRDGLHYLVTTLLTQMLSGDDTGWESQLMMREMNRPTAVFAEMVEEFFRPMFIRVTTIIERLAPPATPIDVIEKMALSVVGQCLYYRVGAGVVRLLIPEERRAASFDLPALALHITGVTLAATENLLAARFGETLTPISLRNHPESSL